MAWIIVDVALAVLGLVVLAALGWRLWRQVQVLGREARAAGQRIQSAAASLDELGKRSGPTASAGPPGVA